MLGWATPGWPTAGRGLQHAAAAERPQALFELAVAVLQLLVLAGELPQLVLQLLDPHFQVDIIGLRRTPATTAPASRHIAAALRNSMKSG